MCGRRKMEKEYPELCDWGDMDFDMIRAIAFQVPRGSVIQYHNNGEPLLYPRLREALALFDGTAIRCLNTNGKLLLQKADDIIDNLETLTVSVIENDPEGGEQYDIVRKFIEIKGERKPSLIYRLLGDVDKEERWITLPGIIASRVLHSPGGSYSYKRPVTIPEIGLCQEILTHLAIDRHGNISMCVRFDPKGELRIGNIGKISIWEAWSSAKRKKYLEYHVAGNRRDLPGCSKCEFWGIPRGK